MDINISNVNNHCVELQDTLSGVFVDTDSQHLGLEKSDHDLGEEFHYNFVEHEEIQIQEEEQVVTEELQSEDVYNCSSCNISFTTSVEEHILQYHKNEEILIAMQSNADKTEDNNLESIDEEENIVSISLPESIPAEDENVDDVDSNGDPVMIMNVLSEKKYVDKDGSVYIKKNVCFNKVVEKDKTRDVTHDSEDTNAIFKCTRCSVQFTDPQSIRAHMETHKPNEDYLKAPREELSLTCEICETTLNSKKSLILHMRIHEQKSSIVCRDPTVEGEQYHCQICDKWFNLEYKSAHEAMHNTHVEFMCNICNKEFPNQEDLVLHVNAHSAEVVKIDNTDANKNYECKHCGKRFKGPYEKVRHERVHTGEKPYSCDVCGKSFRVAYCLTLHKRTHTGYKPYTCDICGKGFKSFPALSNHTPLHSEERPLVCPYCPKTFKTLVQLAGHKKSHTKPFPCSICNRPFSTLYAVKRHMSSHKNANEMNFGCKKCGANYGTLRSLKDHIIQAYGVEEDLLDNVLIDEYIVHYAKQNPII